MVSIDFHFTFLCREVLKFIQSALMNSQSPEEDGIETTGDKLDSLTSDSASVSLNDATSEQIEFEMETKNSTDVHESLGEGEEPFYYCLNFLSSQQQINNNNNDSSSSNKAF
jgi:hypothetical protein